MMDYKIIGGEMIYELAYNVNSWIDKGYEPIGGMSIGKEDYGEHYYQAMIKYEEPNLKLKD
jgi:hypothetical protein